MQNQSSRKIYLLASTIRPKIFISTHKKWMKNSQLKDNIETKVVVDKKEHLEILFGAGYTVYHYDKPNIGICKPLSWLCKNHLEVNDDDIIVVMSDDFYPPKNWDIYLLETFSKIKGGLSVRIDGPYDGARDKIVSLPILDGWTFKKLNGYIYHPSYNHMFSDEELYQVLKKNEWLYLAKEDSEYIFRHDHWVNSKRTRDNQDLELAEKNKWGADKANFEKRKNLSLERRNKHIKLSILICSLHSRKDDLHILLDKLKLIKTDDVEIIVHRDGGELNIGRKRNILLDMAIGDYVCFIDDDDDISDNYISSILEKIEKQPDCIGFQGMMTTNGRFPRLFKHSIQFDKWETKDGVYLRSPNHLNPIKRYIVEQVKFDTNKNSGEDKCFSERVYKYLKTEEYINDTMYYYLFKTTNKSY